MKECCEETLREAMDLMRKCLKGKARLESEWCECGKLFDRDVRNPNLCCECDKPIKPKKELPEKMEQYIDWQSYVKKNKSLGIISIIAEMFRKINQILDYLKEKT